MRLELSYAPLNLGPFFSFEDKLNTVIDWLDVLAVFCNLKFANDNHTPDIGKQIVLEIAVPGGRPGYIRSLLQETQLILKEELNDFINDNETDLYTITQTLKEAKEKCILQSRSNDINKTMGYDPGKIKFISFHGSHPSRLYFENLKFSKEAAEELSDHFTIRKEFYEVLVDIIDKKLADLNEIPPFTRQPYKWTSDNPQFEIAELLYALINTRIQIKEGESGSPAKLVKSFYNLFGYDDSTYHQKLQQINKRKAKGSWLQELPDFIDSVQKRVNRSK